MLWLSHPSFLKENCYNSELFSLLSFWKITGNILKIKNYCNKYIPVEDLYFNKSVFSISKKIYIVNTYKVQRFFCMYDKVLAEKYKLFEA